MPRSDSSRIYTINHWWDDWSQQYSTYSSTAILGADYSYNQYTGLRTAAQFKDQNPSTPSQFRNDPYWSAAEAYGYDADLDYLTEVDYNDGVSNEYQTWGYDAAGNRASDSTYSGGGTWTYDHLNRMSEGAGASYNNDILGNRTEKGTTLDYTWDNVNRLTSIVGTATYNYTYRAEGMRITKQKGSGGNQDSEFRYDGQMLIEEYFAGSVYPRDYTQVIRYGIGARGIDFIERVRTQSGTIKGYPIYDGHGNNVATLTKTTSSPYFSISDRRAYDAWGNIRRGNTTGEPNPRYCANLGHIQDDESGLTYMRARYYEPWTGRFVSEDPARDGINWFAYCANDPVNFVDKSGHERLDAMITLALGVMCLFLGMILLGVGFSYSASGLGDLRQLMHDYTRALQEFGGQLPSDLMDSFMQRELNSQEWRIAGKVNKKVGAGFGAAGAALIGYSLIVQAYLFETELAFMGSNFSILDYFSF